MTEWRTINYFSNKSIKSSKISSQEIIILKFWSFNCLRDQVEILKKKKKKTIKMMTRGVCTMIKTTILLLTLVLLNVVFAAYIPSVETPARGLSKIRRSLPKLCSTALSNTLAIVCRDHGYNEPFSHSENQQRYSLPGPGLVDECCYHSCTIQQLQQYCKAPSEKKSDIMWVNVSEANAFIFFFNLFFFRYIFIFSFLSFWVVSLCSSFLLILLILHV